MADHCACSTCRDRQHPPASPAPAALVDASRVNSTTSALAYRAFRLATAVEDALAVLDEPPLPVELPDPCAADFTALLMADLADRLIWWRDIGCRSRAILEGARSAL